MSTSIGSPTGEKPLEPFKQAQRTVWSTGDYPSLSHRIAEVGERIVARAGIDAGMTVLDVACGPGNAALPAARTGARVTGLDLVPQLLDAGRHAAEQEGLDVEWVAGDAEDLPFADASFDRVLSTFGHMFAPRHARVAEEMARVCRPGGLIATCTWTPEGTVGRMLAIGAEYMPPPPDFASPPILWGTEEHVRACFGAIANDFEFERHQVTIQEESVDAWADFFFSKFGPMVTARQMLGDRFEGMRRRTIAVWEDANQAGDGSLRFDQEYLLSVIHR